MMTGVDKVFVYRTPYGPPSATIFLKSCRIRFFSTLLDSTLTDQRNRLSNILETLTQLFLNCVAESMLFPGDLKFNQEFISLQVGDHLKPGITCLLSRCCSASFSCITLTYDPNMDRGQVL
uniref:Uncharacterized protein n=1 Tax=Trichobilharzia regenti TaxID=157069 RepID=A0AA85J3R0_TRIRE|nr:unnamed protein product [Trichobilharzia regenti]